MSLTLPDSILTGLQEGKLSLRGEFMWGSNYTYLVDVDHAENSFKAVYKPTRGVRPLWDFPPATLARRETAACLVSNALEWNLVPPTVYRKDGPLGPGSVQMFIEHDPEYHYFNYKDEDRQRLRPVVIFDLLLNNADRKGSHLLIDPQGQLWLIDHGLCFHVEEKLRTVIWDFAGERIPENLCGDLERLNQKLESSGNTPFDPSMSDSGLTLQRYLSREEINALTRRARRLVDEGIFPTPDPGRRQYPWPPV